MILRRVKGDAKQNRRCGGNPPSVLAHLLADLAERLLLQLTDSFP